MQIHQAHRDALAKLAIAAEFRDDDTGEHTRRVGNIAARIAQVMGLPKSFVDDIRMAAPLHDVGKIGIPDMILQKPAALTAEEYEKVRERHAVIGEQIPARFRRAHLWRWPPGDVALTHHEKWNGSGYPAGLVGEEIPISGRIVAVADAFDAMTNDRHYRKAIPIDKAVVELKACAGSHFDPAVVEAFVHIVENGVQTEDSRGDLTRSESIPQYQLFSE